MKAAPAAPYGLHDQYLLDRCPVSEISESWWEDPEAYGHETLNGFCCYCEIGDRDSVIFLKPLDLKGIREDYANLPVINYCDLVGGLDEHQ